MTRLAPLLLACCAALPAGAAPSASSEVQSPPSASRPLVGAPGPILQSGLPAMPAAALSLAHQGPDLRLDASVQAAMANPVPNTAAGLRADYFTLLTGQVQAAGAPGALASGNVLGAAAAPGARTAVQTVSARVYDGETAKPRLAADVPEARQPQKTASDYLGRARRLSGSALLRELHDVTGTAGGFKPIGYRSAQLALFASVDRVKVKGRPGARDAYSDAFIDDASRLSVEHVWPQSYYGGNAPMRSDLHQLLPTLADSNAARGDKPYGLKSEDDAFEPPSAAKGRVARAMLYFYARYYDRGIAKTEDKARYWNRQLPVLLDWNRRFPPSAEEKQRNDMAQIEQGNRNPFIDEPGMADEIGEAAFRAQAR